MTKLQNIVHIVMGTYQKLKISVLTSSLAFTVALVIIGFQYGVGTLLIFLAIIFTTVLIVMAALFAKPISVARRLYSERPPRKIYEEISSRDDYCSFETLPYALITAVICSEDFRFYQHKGIDIDCLLKAVAQNLFTSLKPVGASTITQQTIKNIYLTPEAKMSRKFIELFMVRRIEKELSKNEIIELYLNVIYYGCGQHGIRNAARYYYNIEPEGMTFDQCLSLAAILPCPDKYNKAANPKFFYQVKRKALAALLSQSDFPYLEIKLES